MDRRSVNGHRDALPSPGTIHKDLIFNEAKLPEEEPEDHGDSIAVPPAEGYCTPSDPDLPFTY